MVNSYLAVLCPLRGNLQLNQGLQIESSSAKNLPEAFSSMYQVLNFR